MGLISLHWGLNPGPITWCYVYYLPLKYTLHPTNYYTVLLKISSHTKYLHTWTVYMWSCLKSMPALYPLDASDNSQSPLMTWDTTQCTLTGNICLSYLFIDWYVFLNNFQYCNISTQKLTSKLQKFSFPSEFPSEVWKLEVLQKHFIKI
jgi:hypothetical protein